MEVLTLTSDHILQYAAIIITLGGAIGVLRPILTLHSRVKALESKQEKTFGLTDEFKKDVKAMRDESRLADRLLVKAMVEMLDNRITDNNIDGLKKTKSDLMAFLERN